MIDVHSEEYILGQNIKNYRIMRNWTQSRLSEVVNIDRAEISKYESGQNGEMGFKMLKRFAQALDVPSERLLDDTGKTTGSIEQFTERYGRLSPENQKIIKKMLDALLLQQVVVS